MNPLVVLEAPSSLDLSPLTQQLWSERIAHRVVVRGDMQSLIVADARHAHTVADIVKRWRAGTLTPPARESYSVKFSLFAASLLRVPLTLTMLMMVLGCYLWMQFSPFWVGWLEFGQPQWPMFRNELHTYLDIGVWSFWRPTLLHFSLLHLVNNMFWIWVLGRAIETRDGRLPLLLMLIGSGLLGNMMQWWLAGPAFGGISGVVFGLVAWVGWRQLSGYGGYPIPKALLAIMLVILILTVTGDSLVPGLTGMAHGGHIGGLLFGLLLALVWSKLLRR